MLCVYSLKHFKSWSNSQRTFITVVIDDLIALNYYAAAASSKMHSV